MEQLKVSLWDDAWDAKSWEGGHEECAPSAPCWEYATSEQRDGLEQSTSGQDEND